MSVEEVSETRKIEGFEVTVTREGPILMSTLKTVTKDIGVFLDRIEKALEAIEE